MTEARDAADYSDVVRVGIDDTARRRNQSYISIMANLDHQRTVAVTQGRDKGALGRLCSELEPCQYNGQRNLRFFMRSASPLDRMQGLSRGARRTPASPLPARDLLWTYAGGSGCSTTRLNSCALCLVVDASKRRLW